jgi:hypothetical protein
MLCCVLCCVLYCIAVCCVCSLCAALCVCVCPLVGCFGGTHLNPRYHDGLLAGVAAGYCTQADVNAALTNTFTLRFQLGLFDPAESQPFWHVPTSAIATQASQDLNLLATLSSLVLLQVQPRQHSFGTCGAPLTI